MLYYTRAHRPPTNFEINKQISKTEKIGYEPAHTKIMRMIQAGVRLNEFRKEQYDGTIDDDDIALDPTRRPDFDLADASTAVQGINPLPQPEVEVEEPKTDSEPDSE